jgi:hypothetical protein
MCHTLQTRHPLEPLPPLPTSEVPLAAVKEQIPAKGDQVLAPLFSCGTQRLDFLVLF